MQTSKNGVQVVVHQDEARVNIKLKRKTKTEYVSWYFTGFPACCAFGTVAGIVINGYNGDSHNSMSESWKLFKTLLDNNDDLYGIIVDECKLRINPTNIVKYWLGLGSVMFMTLGEPTEELKEFNAWFLQLWKDAWGIEWERVSYGLSKYKNPNKEDYGVAAYVWHHVPFVPATKLEKAA